MGCDNSWPSMVPSVVPTGDCSHWSIHKANCPIPVWMGKVPTGNTQNGGNVLLIANVMAESESGSPDSYPSFLVTTCLSRLVLEIFVCDRQTDNVDHYYSWFHTVAGQLTKWSLWHAAINTLLTEHYSNSVTVSTLQSPSDALTYLNSLSNAYWTSSATLLIKRWMSL